jgi:hypothetical protein
MDSISLARAITTASETDTITWSPWWGSESYPAVFMREDMTSAMAWVKLIAKDTTLQETDFVSKIQYYRYLFLILHILEYSCIIIAGEEGGGKSLLMAFLTYLSFKLFPPKRVTVDWNPPNRSEYGNSLFRLKDTNFVDKLQHDLNKIREYEDEPPEEVRKQLYVSNTIMGLGECSSYGVSNHQGNLMELIVRVSERRRHFDLSMITEWQDPMRIPKVLYNRRTHEISCMEGYMMPGICTYHIMHRKTGIYRYIHLDPKEWTNIWNSKNWVSVSHDIKPVFSPQKKKAKEEIY